MEFALVAFPAIECADLVASVRRRFDPLDGLLGPHVTVVFPFAANGIERALEEHVANTVAGIEPFAIVLEPPRAAADNYILMELSTGADRFGVMHERLYSGILASHRSTAHIYQPHVTIGHLSASEDLEAASAHAASVLPRPLAGQVDSIAGFRLDHPWRGEVVFTLPLGRQPR